MRTGAASNSILLRRLTVAALAALLTVPLGVAQLGGSSASGSLEGAVDGAGDASGTIDATTDGAGTTIDGAVDATGGLSGSTRGALDLSAEVAATVETQAATDLEARLWEAMDEAARAEAEARATAAGIHGFYEVDGDARTGEFSRLVVDAEAAALEGHAVATADGEARFLDSIDLAAGAGADLYDTGSSVVLWADGARVEAQDTAEGSIVVQAAQEPVDVDIDLAAGTSANREDGGWLRLGSGGHDGALTLSGAGAFNTSAQGRVRVHLEPWATLRFEARQDDQSEEDWEEEQDARQEGRVGAEARMTRVGGALQAHLESLSVSLGTAMRDGDSVVLEVSSSDPRPRVVEVTLDADLFENASGDGIQVAFDGEPALRASSEAEVYAGGHAATTYHVTSDGDSHRAVVWVEGFSVHELAFSGDGVDDASSSGGGSSSGGSSEGASSDSGDRAGGEPSGDDAGGLVGVGAPGPALPLLAVGLVGAALVLRRRR